ncbi:hypothetical protein [Pseudoalteromonas gelatinilytica]|uniref:Transmembrane protein n=1 Tax=Pseudoalteromonas gelatinilytica TaxID=1703256 RepID=A0ABQ1TIA5_9GAMM|nr:hypothetical protein [Pseudoalteromonas profundi]GGE93502.1 hypothetical protein GCM10008027_17950 [Pseudoalteromonas profundi]
MSKALKILWHSGAAIFWGFSTLALLIWGISAITPNWCGDEQYEVFLSPDKDKQAVVSVINCGATTNFETVISISRVAQPSEKTILLSLDGHPSNISYKVTWTSNNDIELTDFEFAKLLSFHSRNTVGDIARSHIHPKN